MRKLLFIFSILCMGLSLMACRKEGLGPEKDIEPSPGEQKVIEGFFAVYNENLGKSEEEVEELRSGGDYLALDPKELKRGTSSAQEDWLDDYRPYVSEESLEDMVANGYLPPLLSKGQGIKKIELVGIKKDEDKKFKITARLYPGESEENIAVHLSDEGKILYIDFESFLK